MSKIRVLLVDDSVVIRRVLGDILAAEKDIEIAGTASSGKLAIQKMSQVNPDVVILDVEMPDLNGLEALKILRRDYPKIPVVMFSTLTERGASTTLDALSAGAADYVCKPSNTGSLDEAKNRIRQELVPKIQALGSRSTKYAPAFNQAVKRMESHFSSTSKYSPASRVDIVAIGISTGGPNAMATLLADIPGDLPVPIVVVQHMPPLFTKMLAERLNAVSALKVFEAAEKMELQPGCVYLAPGDYHMLVRREGLVVTTYTNQEQPENSCRPAVDVLFRSVLNVYGGNVLGVIMTGMGKDGFLGCQLFKEAGATVLAQDQASSVVWGMPGYVAEAGLADAVVPLDLLALEITRRVTRSQSIAGADNVMREGRVS